jgi:polysaccharide biosynthesis/export protein
MWFSDVPENPGDAERARRIEDGDRIRIVVHEHAEMSGEHVVSTDGTYVQPLAGPIVVGGLQLDKAAQRIAQKLTPYLKKPVVSVTLLELHTIKVNAIGEVNNTGIYELEHNENVMSLLTLAGGLTEFADRDAIYVLRDGNPPLRIRFRYRDLVQPKPKAIGFVLRDGDTVLVE